MGDVGWVVIEELEKGWVAFAELEGPVEAAVRVALAELEKAVEAVVFASPVGSDPLRLSYEFLLVGLTGRIGGLRKL